MKDREQSLLEIETEVGAGPEVDRLRARACVDLKFLHRDIMLCDNPQWQDSLGKFHDFVYDFLRWEELSSFPEWAVHSPLLAYLPKPDAEGRYPERWLHWPILGEPPRQQDGPDGPISSAFHDGELLKGIVFRIAGSGRVKALLLPRGHLKSSIANTALNMQELIRDSSVRLSTRSQVLGLSNLFMSEFKNYFHNPGFAYLFGHLGPPNDRNQVWNSTSIQVNTPKRRGKEPTLTSTSLGTDLTGWHFDKITLDDIVGENNIDLQDEVRLQIQRQSFVLDKKSKLIDIGTFWSDNDAHSLFVRPSGIYKNTSFMVATVVDDRDKPIWSEYYTSEDLEEKREQCPDDYTWFCQYYNNPYLVKSKRFDRNWIRRYEGETVAMAMDKKLNIVMTVDPANSLNKRSDYTAILVQGQTQDAEYRYILDGARDHYGSETLPKILVDFIEKWQSVARKSGGTFKLGIEETSMTTYLQFPLRDEMRKRGVVCEVIPLKHQNRKKTNRIWMLARPYSTGAVLWPQHGLARTTTEGKPYDLCEELRIEMVKFPYGPHDDVLDTQAYGEELLAALPRRAVPVPETRRKLIEQAYREDETPQRSELGGRYVPDSVKNMQRRDSDSRGMIGRGRGR